MPLPTALPTMGDVPDADVALHFHNTRGVGLACAYAGLQEGITRFEASVAGIGGCPFAPGATGNICSEDLVYMLEESGIHTGIDLDALIAVAQRTEAALGQKLPGQVMKAGPRLRKYGRDEVRSSSRSRPRKMSNATVRTRSASAAFLPASYSTTERPASK